MKKPSVRQVIIEEKALPFPFTQRTLNRLSSVPVKKVQGPLSPEGEPSDAPGKETLCLQSYKGEFLKPCPGTKAYICCGYQILNVGTGCPLDCTYCILQSYFASSSMRVFANLEEGVESVSRRIDRSPEKVFRVGTGEFTDSLALEPLTGWSDLLLPLFSEKRNAVLELKTKTDHIERLLSCSYRDRIIVSWSLNSPWISAREEKGAPGLRKRLEAARRCQSEGFVLGFHFDPLIPHPGWRDDYLRTLDMMNRYIEPRGVIWVSLGSFRFMPELKPLIRRRHPKTCILDGEFVPGLDGKMRYFKPIRIELYAFMREHLEQWNRDLGLYLCMESDEVWEKGLGWSPSHSTGLASYLDGRVKHIFG